MPDPSREQQIAEKARELGLFKASPSSDDATAFLRWFFTTSPDFSVNHRGKDLYETTNGKRRYRLKKRVIESEVKSESGNWIKVSSKSLITAALELLGRAGGAEGEKAATRASEKRKEAGEKAAGKRVEKRRIDLLNDAGMKAVAAENATMVRALALRRGKDDELQGWLRDLENSAYRRGQLFAETSMRDRPVPERAEWVASIDEPLWLALVRPVTYRWVQRMGSDALAIEVEHSGPGKAEVALIATNEQLIGVRSEQLAPKMLTRFWEEAELPREIGYISGRLVVRSGRLEPVLTYIAVAGGRRQGKGTWLLRQWCRFIKAWGADEFTAEAPGNEGDPFLQRLIDRGDLSLLQKSKGGALWRLACRFGATRSIPFGSGEVGAYTPPGIIPPHGPRAWTVASSLRTASPRVHVAAVALFADMLSPFFEGQSLDHLDAGARGQLQHAWDWLYRKAWEQTERDDAKATDAEREEARRIASWVASRWGEQPARPARLPMRAVLELARFAADYGFDPVPPHEQVAHAIAALVKTLWGLRTGQAIDLTDDELPLDDLNQILAEWWVYGPTRFKLKAEGRRGA